jgi:hypothetical protein
MKNLLVAAGVLLQRLADITDLAERTCLSNTNDTSSLSLRVQLEAVKKIDGNASIQQQHSAARGAAEALSGELQKEEDSNIRVCMEPWAQQLREMAAKL